MREISNVLVILEKSEKAFNDMIDWHIAFIQERDEKKQKFYYVIYENKREEYKSFMKELWKQYGY